MPELAALPERPMKSEVPMQLAKRLAPTGMKWMARLAMKKPSTLVRFLREDQRPKSTTTRK